MQRLDSLPQRMCAAALIGVLLLIAVPAHVSANLNELRTAYTEADRLLDQKKVSAWLRRKSRLKRYPLYHYLIIKEVRRTHSDYSNLQISKIISRVDVPLPRNFGRWWLKQLIASKDWGLIIKHFADSTSVETRCVYALAVMRSESREKAIQYIKPLWLVGRSQHKQCDPLFEQAQKKGLIEDDLIWQRMLLTQRRGQLGMSKYLKSLLRSPSIKKWGNRLDSVHRNPKTTIRKHLSKWSQSPYGRDVITHGMVRITRKNPDAGTEFWRELQSKNPSALKSLLATEKEIAQILGWRRHQQAYQWLARLPDSMMDHSMTELMVRNALASEKWSRVLKAIERMDPETADRSEWQYWKARALHKTGNRKQAATILTKLADQRSFYGLLAADQMKLEYNLSPDGFKFNSTDLNSFVESEPAVARIREWLALNEPYGARRELRHLRTHRNGDSQFWSQAALLFNAWGWYDGAIRATYASGHADEFQLELTHPSPYIKLVRKEALRNSVPQHWILGIMRQESLFVNDIRSSAGAIGLMQLLPATARNVAKRNGLKRPSTRDLSNASLNIRLGTTYFKGLLDRLDGNPVHSLAGYNAGPRRVRQWQGTIKASDPAAWIEAIPFTETRNYIKKILVNFILYENIHTAQHTRIKDYLKLPASQHVAAKND